MSDSEAKIAIDSSQFQKLSKTLNEDLDKSLNIQAKPQLFPALISSERSLLNI